MCIARAILSQGGCGSSTSWATPMQAAPPRQGWQEFDVGGMISPIVDDEGCDFLCIEKQTLAEVIETEAHRQGMAGDDAGGRRAQLLTFHVG